MRMLLKITVPVQTGNKTIANGSLPQVVQSTLERLRPECAYFGAENGNRTGYMVFDLKDPSDIPALAEPLFSQLDAALELTPVMNAQDLQAGLGKLAR